MPCTLRRHVTRSCLLGADELVEALESMFAIVESCLNSWTLDVLREEIKREGSARTGITSGGRSCNLFSHDLYHCGEVFLTLGLHGLQ